MLKTKLYLLKPDKVQALSQWLKYLNSNPQDCRTELVHEKVFAESAYIALIQDQHYLIYSMDGIDIQPGRLNELNTKHRSIMRESIEASIEINEVMSQYLGSDLLTEIL